MNEVESVPSAVADGSHLVLPRRNDGINNNHSILSNEGGDPMRLTEMVSCSG